MRPRTAIMLAAITVRRNFSNTCGHTTKALKLLEGLLGESLFIAVGDHAGDELVAKRRHPTRVFEGRHALAKLIRFARREAGADDRDPHRLLLKQRHAERLAEHLFQLAASDRRPAPSLRDGADTDAPYRPGSGPGRTIATSITRS